MRLLPLSSTYIVSSMHRTLIGLLNSQSLLLSLVSIHLIIGLELLPPQLHIESIYSFTLKQIGMSDTGL